MNTSQALFKWFTSKTLRKVPEVTVLFWTIKLLTTAMGESTSDFLVHHFDPVIAVLMGAVGFGIVIILQFLTHKYITWIYWLALVAVAIFGTMAADVVHIALGVPYLTSAVFFSTTLALIFFIWYKFEKTLSIHSINTPRRELFYWLTVITTFALGTAVGDLTAITFKLGYLTSGILFSILFLIPFLLRKIFKINEVFAFWASYIVTRPLGASFADWAGRTPDLGGIGFGPGQTAIVLTVLIILLVGYLSVNSEPNVS